MPNILDHIELWEADRSAEIALPDGGGVQQYLEGNAKVSRKLGGVDQLTLTLRSGSKLATATKDDAYDPSQGKIVRLVYDDASIEEWRIKTRSREFSGEQNPQIICEPIEQDLKTYTVRKTLANGHARASVSFYNQTFEDIVTRLLSADYNCPDLFTLGSVASGLSGTTYNLVLNASYIMEGLKKICQLAEAEWGVTYNATNDNYELNFYESGGLGGGEAQAADRPVAMGGGKGNRLTLEKRDETEEYFSRIVPLMGEGSEIQTVADAKWNVQSVNYDSNAGESTVTLKENAIAKDGYGLIDGNTVYFGNSTDGWQELLSTSAPNQLTVSGDASAIGEGFFREGTNKNDIIFLEDKQALDNVGLKEEKFSRPDIPPYANLIDDSGIAAAMSDWSSGLPVGMQKINGAETVSQEGSDLFVKHGTNSAKVSCDQDQGLQTKEIDLQPEDLNPYFSTTVYVQVETGGVRIELVDANGTSHPVDEVAETNVNETRAIQIGGAEPAAGPARIKVIAQSDSTVFYLDAITLTQSSYALNYAPLMGPKALWIEAGKHLKKYGGDRPDVWRGEVMDDAFFNSGSKEIDVGSFVKVQEDWNEDTQSYDSEFTVRVVECSYRENRIDGRIRKTVRLADKNSQASRVFQEQYLTRESQQSSVGVRSVPNKPIIDRDNAVIEGGTPRFDQVEIFPDTGKAPFILGSNAQGELVTGLNADQLDGYDAADFVRESANNTFTGTNTFDSEARFNTYARFKTDGRIQGTGAGEIEVLADDGTNTGILRVDKVIVNTLEVADEIDQTNTNELKVADQFVVVNEGQTGTPSLDGGLYAERGDQADSYMFWDEGNDRWGTKLGSAGSFDPFILESDIFPNGGYQALGTSDSPEWAGGSFNGGTSGQLKLGNTGATTDSEWWWQVRDSGELQLRNNVVNPNSSVIQVNPSTNYVGIGHSPSYLLDVDGEGRFAGALFDDVGNETTIVSIGREGSAVNTSRWEFLTDVSSYEFGARGSTTTNSGMLYAFNKTAGNYVYKATDELFSIHDYYDVVKINWDTGQSETALLLMKWGNDSGKRLNGSIHLGRSTGSSTRNQFKIDISASEGDNRKDASMQVQGYGQSLNKPYLAQVEYNSETYLAIIFKGTSAAYYPDSQNYFFGTKTVSGGLDTVPYADISNESTDFGDNNNYFQWTGEARFKNTIHANGIRTNARIQSYNYTSGIFGEGARFSLGFGGSSFLELDNARIRGTLRSHIFKKDIVKASNAFLYISDAGELVNKVTTPSTTGSTFDIHIKEPVFDVGDKVEFKDEDLSSGGTNIYQVKATVDSYDNTNSTTNDHIYTLTLNSGTDIPLEAGDTFVRTSGGALLADASSQYSPFLDVMLDSDTKVRLGNVRGIGSLNLSSDTWGLYAKDNIFLDFGTSDIFKIGKDVGGSGEHGVYINGGNYWYGTGQWRVGGTTNYISHDGNGNLYATMNDFLFQAGNYKIGTDVDGNGADGMQVSADTYIYGDESFSFASGILSGTANSVNISNWVFEGDLFKSPDTLVVLKESSISQHNGSGRLLIGRWHNTARPTIRISGNTTDDYVEMYHDGGTNKWGMRGEKNGSYYFQLGSENEIAGWAFGSSRLASNNIEIHSDGRIRHTGDYWRLNSDGSGVLANGAINWDGNGYARIENNVDIFGNLSVSSLPQANDEGLIALYHFDGDLLDSVRKTKGVKYGTTYFDKSISGQGIYLDGDSDHVVIDGPVRNQTDFTFSVSVFIKPANNSSSSIVVKAGTADTDTQFKYESDNSITLKITDVANGNIRQYGTSSGLITQDEWNQVGFAIDEPNNKLYLVVNGEIVRTVTDSNPIGEWDNDDWRVGYRGYSQLYFEGGIDELRVYERILSAKDWKSLATNPSGNATGIISANQMRTGRLESTNLDRGSGTYTNTGTLFNLDQGDIISEEFSVINGIANFKGTLNSEVGGNIGGWEIYSGSEPYLQASNNGSIIQMKSGSQPEFYFQAPNGEELHIGGEYSFDQEDDVNLGSTSIGQVSEGANATSGNNISDTSSYYHTETLSNNYDGRVFEVSATYDADTNVSGSGSASVRCEIILRFRDSSNNVLDTVSTSSSSGSDVIGKPISVSGVVPSGTDDVQVEVKLTANASAADDGKVNTASSSITYNGDTDVMTVVGTNEFISPLGFSFVNEEQTGVTRKPRILGDRNTGRLLAHEFVVENEDGDQFTLEVTTGSNPQLRILDENGTAVDSFG